VHGAGRVVRVAANNPNEPTGLALQCAEPWSGSMDGRSLDTEQEQPALAAENPALRAEALHA
jgi:hypothetical protein